MPVNLYKIAAGWNNAAGLANVEGITPSPAPTFYLNTLVDSHNYDANTSYMVMSSPISENRIFTPGGSIQNGYARQDWIFQIIGDDALKYWRATYVGQFTIATKVDEVYDVYANKNVIIEKPFVTLEQRVFKCETWVWEDVVVPLYIVGAAS